MLVWLVVAINNPVSSTLGLEKSNETMNQYEWRTLLDHLVIFWHTVFRQIKLRVFPQSAETAFM